MISDHGGERTSIRKISVPNFEHLRRGRHPGRTGYWSGRTTAGFSLEA